MLRGTASCWKSRPNINGQPDTGRQVADASGASPCRAQAGNASPNPQALSVGKRGVRRRNCRAASQIVFHFVMEEVVPVAEYDDEDGLDLHSTAMVRLRGCNLHRVTATLRPIS
jgi:hypothetical protein